MPFSIRKSGTGFLVCDKKRCFSRSPLTKKKAQKQRIAIALSEQSKNPEKPIGTYFV